MNCWLRSRKSRPKLRPQQSEYWAGLVSSKQEVTAFGKFILPGDKEIRFIFFGGKSGISKSTLSAATEVWLADSGYRTLLISTDLQRSLDDILERAIDITPMAITEVDTLWALDTDVEQSIAEHQLKQIAVMESLPELDYIERHYTSSPCCETASWNRTTEFMNTTDYELLVFDTASGGHSLETILYPLKQANSLYTMIGAKKITAESRGKEALTGYGFKLDGLLINEILSAHECERLTQSFEPLRAQQDHYVQEAKSALAT